MAIKTEKPNVVEPKRGDLEEPPDRHRQVHEAAERSTQQTLNQGMNTGTGDVQRVSDWGTAGKSKRHSSEAQAKRSSKE